MNELTKDHGKDKKTAAANWYKETVPSEVAKKQVLKNLEELMKTNVPFWRRMSKDEELLHENLMKKLGG